MKAPAEKEIISVFPVHASAHWKFPLGKAAAHERPRGEIAEESEVANEEARSDP
jgi:hypothetical protein